MCSISSGIIYFTTTKSYNYHYKKKAFSSKNFCLSKRSFSTQSCLFQSSFEENKWLFDHELPFPNRDENIEDVEVSMEEALEGEDSIYNDSDSDTIMGDLESRSNSESSSYSDPFNLEIPNNFSYDESISNSGSSSYSDPFNLEIPNNFSYDESISNSGSSSYSDPFNLEIPNNFSYDESISNNESSSYSDPFNLDNHFGYDESISNNELTSSSGWGAEPFYNYDPNYLNAPSSSGWGGSFWGSSLNEGSNNDIYSYSHDSEASRSSYSSTDSSALMQSNNSSNSSSSSSNPSNPSSLEIDLKVNKPKLGNNDDGVCWKDISTHRSTDTDSSGYVGNPILVDSNDSEETYNGSEETYNGHTDLMDTFSKKEVESIYCEYKSGKLKKSDFDEIIAQKLQDIDVNTSKLNREYAFDYEGGVDEMIDEIDANYYGAENEKRAVLDLGQNLWDYLENDLLNSETYGRFCNLNREITSSLDPFETRDLLSLDIPLFSEDMLNLGITCFLFYISRFFLKKISDKLRWLRRNFTFRPGLAPVLGRRAKKKFQKNILKKKPYNLRSRVFKRDFHGDMSPYLTFNNQYISKDSFNSWLCGLVEASGTFVQGKTQLIRWPRLLMLFSLHDTELTKNLIDYTNLGTLKVKKNQGVIIWEIEKADHCIKILNSINGYMRTSKIKELEEMVTWFYIHTHYKIKPLGLDLSPINSNSWLAGFSDAIGNFNIILTNQIKKGLKLLRVQNFFRIEKNLNYIKATSSNPYNDGYAYLFSEIAKYFSVNLSIKSKEKKGEILVTYKIISYNIESNLKVIEYFDRNQLLSFKSLLYKNWKFIINKNNLYKGKVLPVAGGSELTSKIEPPATNLRKNLY